MATKRPVKPCEDQAGLVELVGLAVASTGAFCGLVGEDWTSCTDGLGRVAVGWTGFGEQAASRTNINNKGIFLIGFSGLC